VCRTDTAGARTTSQQQSAASTCTAWPLIQRYKIWPPSPLASKQISPLPASRRIICIFACFADFSPALESAEPQAKANQHLVGVAALHTADLHYCLFSLPLQTPPRTPLERPARESSQNSSSRATVLGSSTIRNSQSPLINSTPRQRSPLLEFLPRVLPELAPPAASTGPSWCYGAVSQSVSAFRRLRTSDSKAWNALVPPIKTP
jgi:hypothetical protein